MSWWKSLKGNSSTGVPLKDHTTFKIGGAAAYFIEPWDNADLKLLINLTKRYKIRCLVIGAGSNILVSDKGVDRAVVHLGAPYFRRLAYKENIIEAGAGISLPRLIDAASKVSFSGLEFLAGIPGTLGGALAMNAGAWGECIGDMVRDVTVADRAGAIKTIPRDKILFGYRTSDLDRYIIVSARLRLISGKESKIKERIAGYLRERAQTQELSFPSAGCVFKNPRGDSAGRLIEECGLKGRRIGGALVSLKHANFIVNAQDATSRDVLALMRLVKKEVKNKFQIELEPEIKVWK